MKDDRLLLDIPPPRKVRRTAAVGACVRILIGVVALALIFVVVIVLPRVNDRQALLERGKTKQALVYEKRTSSKNGHRSVLFEFYVDAIRYTGAKDVSEEDFDQTKLGDPVLVTYLPESPQSNLEGTVTPATVAKAKDSFVFLLLIVLGAGILGWVVFESIVRRELNLLERGFAVEGEIIALAPRAVNNTLYYGTSFRYSINGVETIGRVDLSSTEGAKRKIRDRVILLVDISNTQMPRLIKDLKFAECPDLDF